MQGRSSIRSSWNRRLAMSTGLLTFQQTRRYHVPNRTLVPGAVSGHLTFNGSTTENDSIVLVNATGGTFSVTITVGSNSPVTLSGVAWNRSTANFQSDLQAMSNVGVNNVLVTGSPGNYVLQFQQALAFTPIIITVDASLLTGPTGFAVSAYVLRNQIGNNSTLVPLVGGHDDVSETYIREAAAVSLHTDGSTADRLVLVSGNVTVPTPPQGSEETTRKIWRGHVFGNNGTIKINT